MTENTRPFRFGVVAPVLTELPAWREQVRRIEGHGYSTLLAPDVPHWQPSPAATLAVAATLTNLRVGTWVYASPFRLPWQLAWEAHSLTQLTEGRFEFGIGMGRPGLETQLAELGAPASTPGERIEQVRAAVAGLRELDGDDRRTPVAMAVAGPKARAMAAELADIVTFSAPPGGASARTALYGLAAGFRDRDVELALHVSIVGDVVAPFMAGPDIDLDELRAIDSLLMLPDDPAAAAEELLRRRAEAGFSYVVVGSNAADAFAPVVAELAGR